MENLCSFQRLFADVRIGLSLWQGQWVRSSSAKRKLLRQKSKTQVWCKTQLKTKLDIERLSRQRLGLRIFLDLILVLDFCLSHDLSQENV